MNRVNETVSPSFKGVLQGHLGNVGMKTLVLITWINKAVAVAVNIGGESEFIDSDLCVDVGNLMAKSRGEMNQISVERERREKEVLVEVPVREAAPCFLLFLVTRIAFCVSIYVVSVYIYILNN